MNFNIKNNSSHDLSQLTNLVREFYPYAKKHMGFNRDANIFFESDLQNAKNPLGKTAYYNPEDFSVTIYVDGRHPKDIMRSVSHELVHHHQNCDGKLDNIGPTHEGYAQSDTYLREMEEDAYKRGNLVFRDWENQKNIKEIRKMKVTKEELKNFVYEAMKELLAEQSRTDLPDRARPEGGRRLDEEDEEIEEGAKPDFLDVDKDGDKEESMKDATDSVKEEQDIFAPNHYCVHHGGVNHNGAVQMAEAVNHNYNEELGRVTHYDMKLKDGTVLENVAYGDIRVTNASLAEGHSHPMKRDDEEEKELQETTDEAVTEETEEVTTEEVESEELKEWHNNSLYKKLLKEYTKR